MKPEPIAVVGIACRFPGAPDAAAFFRMLEGGIDAIREVPPDRWDAAALHDPDPTAAGKTITRLGGFLDRVDGFDAAFFGISPREAVEMDPQQRLMLEVSWEALEDAGIAPREIAGSRTGVFYGAMWRDYGRVPGQTREAIAQHTATGQDLSILAARVSHALGLEGPSVALNTACSSSLVAVHLACQSLRSGETDLALAGGVNLILAPESSIAMSRFGGLSPDGRSFAFDARANGYARGEGAGVVVLKPLSRAIADGDPIACVILGSAVNNDGANGALSAPSPRAQEAVIREAWASAGVDPAEAQYVEAHGTGTALGDRIEAEALGAAMGAGRAADRPLAIGSVKTNVGHLETAAGAAGLIKVALAMRHRVIPASLHFERPNPAIPFDALGLRVQREAGPWPEPDRIPMASVSAFGFGGTNAHVVVRGAAADSGATLVFSGHGAQHRGMGRALLGEPAFRAAIERCDHAARAHGVASLAAAIEDPSGNMDDPAIGWPAIVAVGIGVAAVLHAWGVRPQAVVGHSIGEIAAAHVAGAISIDDAMRIACTLGRFVARAPGAMALVGLSWDEAGEAIAGREGRVARAVDASPGETVLSGDAEALDEVLAAIEQRGAAIYRVRGAVAAHGPALAAMRSELAAALEGIQPGPAAIPIVSSVTGTLIEGGALGPDHWARGLAEPVRLRGAIGLAARLGHAAFVEVSAHPVARRSIEATLRAEGRAGLVVATLHRDADGPRALLDAHAAVHAFAWARRGAALPIDEAPRLVPISAATPEALAASIEAHRIFVASAPGRALGLDAIATAAGARGHHAHRVAVIARSTGELSTALAARKTSGRLGDAPKLVFVLSGQGSQWATMGRELHAREPVFRGAIDACDRAFARWASWSIADALTAEEGASRLDTTEVAQPAIVALQIALAALHGSWGIHPDAVIGHSVGELAAAHIAGAIGLDDVMHAVHVRGRSMQRTAGLGEMAAVEAAAAIVARAMEGLEDRLAIAAFNDPGSVVISGDPSALDEALARLAREGVGSRRLRVDHAFHAPGMDDIARELELALAGLVPAAPAIPMYSTVNGARVDGTSLDAGYWARNVREPVRFADAVRAAASDGHTLFLEVGPHPVLTANVARGLAAMGATGRAIPSLRRGRDERRSVLESLAALFEAGRDLAFPARSPGRRAIVSLPAYPWQRERFWPDATRERRRIAAREDAGLGAPFTVSTQLGHRFWELGLDVETSPHLADHRVEEAIVAPGALWIDLALAAAAAAHGAGPRTIEDVAFERMLTLPADATRTVQLALGPVERGRAAIEIASLGEGDVWIRHARAAVRVDRSPACEAPIARAPASLDATEGCEAHYRDLAARGLAYGPAYRAVERIGRAAGEITARVRVPESAARQGDSHVIHPALLDACFQLLASLVPGAARVPIAIERLRVHGDPRRATWAHARTRPVGDGDAVAIGDALLIADDGGVLVEATGVRLRALPPKAAALDARWLHAIAWRSVAALPEPARPAQRGAWLVASDRGGAGAELAAILRGLGERCVRLVAGARRERVEPDLIAVDPADREGLRAVVDELAASGLPLRGAVHLWSLDATPAASTTAETIAADAPLGALGGLHLAQALLARPTRDPPRLWLVTRGAERVSAGCAVEPAGAPLRGLGRVLALEHPELGCTLIDLAHGDPDAAALARELFASGEDQVALRPEGRFGARLVRSANAIDRARTAPLISGDATYLVTGGLGALGVGIAQRLVDRGARHVVLAGRSAPSAAARAAMDAMAASGARVEARACDVAARADVEALFAWIDASRPPLRGVVHAAAVLDDRTALALTASRLARVLAPKVEGAWNLHALTLGRALDFFVLYSSVAALVGSPGQANYAAANAYLDALASHRRALGLPGASLAFGPFTVVGLAAADPRRGDRLAIRGIEGIRPDQGLAALERLIDHDGPIAIVPLDARRFIDFHPSASRSPFWSELLVDQSGPRRARADLGEVIRAAAAGERTRVLEREIGARLATVIGLDAARIDRSRPFGALGMDSLMSLELKNRLEADLDLTLPATLLFTYPSIARLAAHLLDRLGLARPSDPVDRAPDRRAEARAEVASLSDEDAEARLVERLRSIGSRAGR